MHMHMHMHTHMHMYVQLHMHMQLHMRMRTAHAPRRAFNAPQHALPPDGDRTPTTAARREALAFESIWDTGKRAAMMARAN